MKVNGKDKQQQRVKSDGGRVCLTQGIICFAGFGGGFGLWILFWARVKGKGVGGLVITKGYWAWWEGMDL